MKPVLTFLALVGAACAARVPLGPALYRDGGAQRPFGSREPFRNGAAHHSSSSSPNRKPKGFTASNLLDKVSIEVDGQPRNLVTYATGASTHNPLTGWDDSKETVTYELIEHDEFPQYSIRLRQPRVCDPHVLQYSGYLDIAEDKHLFFWCVRSLG
ncbi:hypothetical protein DL93DRAFT_2084561 [Clavulina sp. PMI_390]|nr:hypothetical protein DL93DRAFT_2084561 [Clavulina sp. PMI_390]